MNSVKIIPISKQYRDNYDKTFLNGEITKKQVQKQNRKKKREVTP